MNKQIYLGSTPLIDLAGYATESYVDTAVSNVDVTEQLQNYVLTTTLDASYGALDASIKSSDASISAIKTTLADIVSDGSVDAAINTWAEMKAFVADYTSANDLLTLINGLKTDAVADAAADAASKYQVKGNYLVAADIADKVDAAAVSAAIDSSIKALDLENTYQPKGSYLVASDLAPYAKDASLADYAKDASLTALDASVAANYMKKTDASNHVTGNGVTSIVYCTSTDYAAITTKDPSTLYIVTD